jgi:integrase
VIVLLSAKAGLRAGEIANLTWDMVLDSRGHVGFTLDLHNNAAKNGSGRVIPVHADLRRALIAWREISIKPGPIIRSERGGPMTALSIVVWFNRAFRIIGLNGCSSHSGRRTFITRAARLVHNAGGSLRDVQLLAGHRSKQLWNRRRLSERFLEGVEDWLLTAGWVLIYSGSTFGALRAKTIKGWSRVSSKHLATELGQVVRGTFKFDALEHLWAIADADSETINDDDDDE